MKFHIRSPILSGLVLMLAIVVIGSLVVALLLQFTGLSERNMPVITYAVNALSLVVGGFVAGRKARERGWLYGGVTGVLYTLVLLLISFLAFDAAVTSKTFVSMISSFAIAAIGGMLGVNFSR